MRVGIKVMMQENSLRKVMKTWRGIFEIHILKTKTIALLRRLV